MFFAGIDWANKEFLIVIVDEQSKSAYSCWTEDFPGCTSSLHFSCTEFLQLPLVNKIKILLIL